MDGLPVRPDHVCGLRPAGPPAPDDAKLEKLKVDCMETNVRELKSRPSEYLHQAAACGEVLVALRGKPFPIERDWPSFEIVGVTHEWVRRAGELADMHRLRGCDSLHLAAAETVWRLCPRLGFRFSVFDGIWLMPLRH